MVYITYVDEGTTPEPDPPLAPEDKPEPGSIKKPGGLENPSSSALQQEAPVAGGSVSTNQPEVEVATQDPMEVEPPEPFITGDASRPPLRQETTGSKLKEEGLELGGALFALAGLAALSFAWSIGSDLRVILWFRRKSREIGSRR